MIPSAPLRRAAALAAALCLATAAHYAAAQAVVMAGSYQNFDVLNNNGQPACGFEMEVWGVSKSQLTRIFPSNFNPGVIRYGLGTAVDFPGGVYVRWMSPYDASKGQFTACTPVPASLKTVPGESCWTLGMPSTYATAGCEHFGISSTVNPTRILYRWLLPDPAVPGQLVRAGTDVAMPAPLWVATPPANPALPPVVAAEVAAPRPPAPQVFGDAQWIKVYKTENRRPVDLEELMGDNRAVVPAEAGQVAAANLDVNALGVTVSGGGDVLSGDKVISCPNKCYGVYAPGAAVVLSAKARSGSRFVGWSGGCAGNASSCTVLMNAETTVTATFVAADGGGGGGGSAPKLAVAVAGSGSVGSTPAGIDCGKSCSATYAPGTVVTVTATPAAGQAFLGWNGACSGTAASCTVVLQADTKVGASFTK